jgi:hypothetical protein
MAHFIDLTKDFKQVQEEQTQREIQRMQDYAELITLEEMQTRLQAIGLRLDLNTNSYAWYYYNTNNENPYNEMTTSPLDSKRLSPYNVESAFYNKYLKGMHTGKGLILDELRNKYFCTITRRKQTYIVSF